MENTFELVLEGARRERARVSYPSGGYGGHELVISPSERYVAVWLYTGQSEESFELFELTPKLRHLFSFPWISGEGCALVFAPDECFIGLATVLRGFLLARGDEKVIHWADVRVLEIATEAVSSCRIDVRLPDPASASDSDEMWRPESLRFVPGGIRLVAGWGEVCGLPMPLPESAILSGPSEIEPVAKPTPTWSEAKLSLAATRRSYSTSESFAAGEWLEHPKFGAGLVYELIEGKKMKVLFESGSRILAHAG